jgi:hypothetical protein
MATNRQRNNDERGRQMLTVKVERVTALYRRRCCICHGETEKTYCIAVLYYDPNDKTKENPEGFQIGAICTNCMTAGPHKAAEEAKAWARHYTELAEGLGNVSHWVTAEEYKAANDQADRKFAEEKFSMAAN